MTTDRRFAALLATAVLAVVPPASAPAAGPVEGAVGAGVRAAFPGLYVPDTVAVQGDAHSGFVVRTALPCAALESVFAAGDWRVAESLAVPPEAAPFLAIGGLAPMTLLADGAATAGLVTNSRPDGCRARLIAAAAGPVALGGEPAPAAADGWSLATRCLRTADELLVDVLVGGADASAQFHVVVDPDGTAALDESTDSIVVTGQVGLLTLMSTMLAAELAGAEPVVPDGSTFATASSGSGTATLDGDGTSGTIRLTGIEWDDNFTGASGTTTAEFPFHCAAITHFG